MPSKIFIYDGIPSSDFGIFISGNQTFNGAEKDVEKVSIPGRSGDLILPSRRFQNVEHRYDAWVAFDLDRHIAAVREYLLSKDGYCRLEDEYHPNEFYMAHFAGPMDFDVLFLTAGQTTLVFDRKPQRFLKSGEQIIEVAPNSSVEIGNPTAYISDPLIEFNGATSGSFMVNNTTVTITNSVSNVLMIDSDIQQTYNGTSNLNGYISITDDTYPVFKKGRNVVTNNSTATLKIKPRWYTI